MKIRDRLIAEHVVEAYAREAPETVAWLRREGPPGARVRRARLVERADGGLWIAVPVDGWATLVYGVDAADTITHYGVCCRAAHGTITHYGVCAHSRAGAVAPVAVAGWPGMAPAIPTAASRDLGRGRER